MRRALLFAIPLAAACATLADGEPGLDNPPTMRAGPFRLLRPGELAENRVPPNAVDDQVTRFRDVTVLDPDEQPATLAVEGYFAANALPAEGEDPDPEAPPARIVRLHAADGRSFNRAEEVVLEASQPWEGGRVGAPTVILDRDGQRLLYYEAEEGIGLARIPEVGAGTGSAAPVLSRDDVPWASGPLKSPGAVRMPDGSLRMYFETERGDASAIGVASSDDGENWIDRGPVLEPAGTDIAVDGAYVGSPHAVLGTSAEDRDVLYVYYTARSLAGKQSIALAARFLADGGEALEPSRSSMYGPPGSVEPHEPCVVRFEAYSFLFSSQKPAKTSPDVVVTVGVSPGDTDLSTVSAPAAP